MLPSDVIKPWLASSVLGLTVEIKKNKRLSCKVTSISSVFLCFIDKFSLRRNGGTARDLLFVCLLACLLFLKIQALRGILRQQRQCARHVISMLKREEQI